MRALLAIAALVLAGCGVAEAQIESQEPAPGYENTRIIASYNCASENPGGIGPQYNYAKCKQDENEVNQVKLSDNLAKIIETTEARWVEENQRQRVGEGWFDRRQSVDIFLSSNKEWLVSQGLLDLPKLHGSESALGRLLRRAENSAQLATNIPKLSCHGMAMQGGLAICETVPNAAVEVGRAENDTYTQYADAEGIIIVGFDRDEPAAFIRVRKPRIDLHPNAEFGEKEIEGESRIDFDITPREYDISRIDGLPSNMVSSYTEEELARIRSASARKKVGFASKVEEIGFTDGFIYPVTEHRKTTNFGAQRILNGEPKRPHFGVDLAAPKGTPILAPADGIVSLADDDMYFEGSLIMIDHGQGLISYYLHNEDVLVEEGQRVKQGEQIGTVGSRGRSTGPHLCWRLKWRGRNLDPELLTNWQTEAKSHG